jgi:hypothetical protein
MERFSPRDFHLCMKTMNSCATMPRFSQQAVRAETAGALEQAFDHYVRAIESLQTLLKYEKQDAAKAIVLEKIRQYMVRCEAIKAGLLEQEATTALERAQAADRAGQTATALAHYKSALDCWNRIKKDCSAGNEPRQATMRALIAAHLPRAEALEAQLALQFPSPPGAAASASRAPPSPSPAGGMHAEPGGAAGVGRYRSPPPGWGTTLSVFRQPSPPPAASVNSAAVAAEPHSAPPRPAVEDWNDWVWIDN